MTLLHKTHNRATRVATNAAMLYLLTFSNYILYLITIPYQTRVLNPEMFGQVNFAMSFALYFQLAIDFGFTILGTELAARYSSNRKQLSRLLALVMVCRLVISAVLIIAFSLLCIFTEPFNQDPLLYITSLAGSIFAALMPDFIYRGMENMRFITIRTIVIRTFFMAFVFLLVKREEDYIAIPLLVAVGNLVAFTSSLLDLARRGIVIRKVAWRDVYALFKKAVPFFLSRIAVNIYSASNIFVVGLIHGAASVVAGLYSSSDRLLLAAKSGMTPLIDSIYPHMVKTKNFKLIFKLLIVIMPPLSVCCIAAAVFAEDIMGGIFGPAYAQAGDYLRILSLVVWISFPAMLIGFPLLAPMNLSQHANRSTVYGSAVHLLQLAILFSTGNLTVTTVCIATVITELFTLSYRVSVVYIHRRKLLSQDR